MDDCDVNLQEATTISHLRPLRCELSLLSRSDGSSILTQGQTAVMVSLYGPVEVRLQNLLIHKASIEVKFIPKSGISGVADRLKEKVIQNTVETALMSTLYPRSAVNINILEMQDSGGLLSCAVNASCLALLNSGVQMKFLIAAVHCIVNKNNEIVIDPHDRLIVNNCNASFVFVFDNIDRKLITSYTTGKYNEEQYMECLQQCKEASLEIFKFYRDIIKKSALII
ncbi:exosome complex component RRP46 [Ctenocephalides felis]|uniref:exosome complex component RRP46 n=1 Tax=Ctenocephalides felis TaxID=7515 RepID=UPI000E6E2261|nr:exosome complex component RRP46 [Ctenocephalides felis]